MILMSKNLVYPLLFLLIFFLIPVFSGKIEAASFGFDKLTYSVATDATVEVQVTVDAGLDKLNGVDAYIKYDPSLVSVDSVTDGSFFPTVTKETGTSGTVWISGMVDDPAISKTGTGTLATITLKGLKDGSDTISFECDSSKIVKNDINASNVLDCNKNTNASIEIGAGGPSAEPTATPEAAAPLTPPTLPKSGVFDNVVKMAIPGLILFLVGGAFRLLL